MNSDGDWLYWKRMYERSHEINKELIQENRRCIKAINKIKKENRMKRRKANIKGAE